MWDSTSHEKRYNNEIIFPLSSTVFVFVQVSTALTALEQEHFNSFGAGIVVLVRIVLRVDPPP